MIVKAPGVESYESEATISLVDLYPTLLDYCGLEKPDQPMDGKSFLPLLKDKDAIWDRPSFTSYGIHYSSVRNEEFRYIQYPDQSEELYRYESDPLELNNVVDDPKYKEIKAHLKTFIPKKWADTTGGRLEVPHDYDKVMRPRSKWDNEPPSS